MANINVVQWRQAKTENGVITPIPSGYLTSQIIDTTSTTLSAVIRQDCGIVEIYSDIATNVRWDGSADPGTATTAHIPIPANLPQFFDMAGVNATGLAKLSFRNAT